MLFKSLTTWLVLILGAVFGVLILGGIRFATYSVPEPVHYHANFAVFVNGQQEQFKDPGLYEETSMCTTSTTKTPMERAHMHDQVNNVIHVEDSAVTWGQFFENIGWSVGNKFISSSAGMYANSDQGNVSYILNGNATSTISNSVINDNDKLLVSYGNTSAAELANEYSKVPSTAHHYDVTKDPKSCSGHAMTTTIRDRLKYAFQL